MTASQAADLQSRCDLLRSLHRPGTPLLLPNAWDVATARAVVAAGFPVVATTSAGVAATLGYEDQEDAPADEMLAAAARIARGVEVPVTVDAEAGYGMQPAKLVAALRSARVAGCNLEDTDHTVGGLRDPDHHAEWLLPEALRRANAYLEAGADCVYPIVLWEPDALRRFTAEIRGPVNVARLPQMPSLAALAAAGVARVSWGPFLFLDAMARF